MHVAIDDNAVHHDSLWPICDPRKETGGKGITESQRVIAAGRNHNVEERCRALNGIRHVYDLMGRVDRIRRVNIGGEPGAQLLKTIEPGEQGVGEVILRAARYGDAGDCAVYA